MTDNEIHWPQGVMDALRSRGHSDEKIATMEPILAFSEFCDWNGLLGWGESLWKIIREMEAHDPKDEGLIASEADFLNTELRMNYGDHLQVEMNDDWRPAIRGLVYGVHYGEEFNRRWRPIDTAPKDGTRVLVAVVGEYGPDLKIAGYNFHWREDEQGGSASMCDLPTHWMPLPEAPTSD